MDKVDKYGREHCYESKIKRKERENMSLRLELKKRESDIKRNFTYKKGVGVSEFTLVPKKKEKPPNICKHKLAGCDVIPRHKTARSRHCIFYGKSQEEIEQAQKCYLAQCVKN